MKKLIKLMKLPSVGSWLDCESHELYPEDEHGNPVLDCFLPNRLRDALEEDDFKSSLSIEDAKRLNKFIGGAE